MGFAAFVGVQLATVLVGAWWWWPEFRALSRGATAATVPDSPRAELPS